MTPSLLLLCVEDEPAVLDAIIRDLAPFENHFRLEAASSAADARDLLATAQRAGHPLALILCDHLMPGTSGTDFLIELHHEPATQPAHKILLTAQAGHDDTIRAVNRAELNHYLAKPWDPAELQSVVRRHLTDYILEQNINPLPYLTALDAPRLTAAIHRHGLATDA